MSYQLIELVGIAEKDIEFNGERGHGVGGNLGGEAGGVLLGRHEDAVGSCLVEQSLDAFEVLGGESVMVGESERLEL